jgi:ABC-type polysaccharide/polyol phosphate transport system ATPase subunit
LPKNTNIQIAPLILITHVPDAVERHCTRCIVIEKQEKIFDGPAAKGVAVYRNFLPEELPLD